MNLLNPCLETLHKSRSVFVLRPHFANVVFPRANRRGMLAGAAAYGHLQGVAPRVLSRLLGRASSFQGEAQVFLVMHHGEARADRGSRTHQQPLRAGFIYLPLLAEGVAQLACAGQRGTGRQQGQHVVTARVDQRPRVLGHDPGHEIEREVGQGFANRRVQRRPDRPFCVQAIGRAPQLLEIVAQLAVVNLAHLGRFLAAQPTCPSRRRPSSGRRSRRAALSRHCQQVAP